MHFTKKFQRQAGFTLIELMIVIAVISILASIGIGYYKNSIAQAQKVVCWDNMSTGERLYQVYQMQGGTFNPVNTTGLRFLVDAGILAAEPICKAGGTYTWSIDTTGTVHLTCSIHGNAQTALLYESTFDNDTGIVGLTGNWNIAGGTLVPTFNGENRAVFSGTEAADYAISMNAQLNSGNGYGIYYHATKDANISGYIFQFDPGLGNQFAVRKVTNGKEAAPFQSVSMASVMGSSFDIHASHAITINVQGSNQTISVDGKQVLSFSDSTFTSGYVGARSWNNSQVKFQDVSVVKQ